MIVRRQAIERRGDCVELHVRSRPHELVCILLEDDPAGVEGNDLDREEAWFQCGLTNYLSDARLEFGK